MDRCARCRRSRPLGMIIVGLTGSIGMGKSTAVRFIRREGVPVYDADAAVHEIYRQGGAAVEPIRAAFPGAIVDGAVDRVKLSKLVLNDLGAIRTLEGIVHPLVRQVQERFLHAMARRRMPMVVMDIPLLFETGGDDRVDAIIVVSAPAALQRQRVLARPGMTEEKFEQILARQTPDREKRRQADVVIPTQTGFVETGRRLRRALEYLRQVEARVWPTFTRVPQHKRRRMY